MEDLTLLPNIGAVGAARLTEVGITTLDQLKSVGSKEALLRIRASIDPGACLHELYAFEGAIQGIPKKNLSPEVKNDLREFFNDL